MALHRRPPGGFGKRHEGEYLVQKKRRIRATTPPLTTHVCDTQPILVDEFIVDPALLTHRQHLNVVSCKNKPSITSILLFAEGSRMTFSISASRVLSIFAVFAMPGPGHRF